MAKTKVQARRATDYAQHHRTTKLPLSKTHHNAEGCADGPSVKHVSEILGEVSDDPSQAPEGEDEDVKEKLTELLSLVVHGGGGQQRS